MANDSDWVADVRRWCLSNPRGKTVTPIATDAPNLEVAHRPSQYTGASAPQTRRVDQQAVQQLT